MEITEKDKEKILNLFFNTPFSIKRISQCLNGKYEEKEISKLIRNKIDSYVGDCKNGKPN